MSAPVKFVESSVSSDGINVEVIVEGETAGYIDFTLAQWSGLRERELDEVGVFLREEFEEEQA